MSSGDVNVNFDAVRQNASRLGTVHDEIVNELATVGSQMRELESNGFRTPQASQQFQQLFNEWKTRATELMRTMRDTKEAMNQAMQQHEETERAHAEQARTIADTGGSGA